MPAFPDAVNFPLLVGDTPETCIRFFKDFDRLNYGRCTRLSAEGSSKSLGLYMLT